MSRDKHIEEMAKSLNEATFGVNTQTLADHLKPETINKVAEHLYNAGYRKQSEGENISQMHPSDEFICEKCGLIIRECCRYEIDEDDGDEICYEFPYRFCPRCGMKVKGGVEQ